MRPSLLLVLVPVVFLSACGGPNTACQGGICAFHDPTCQGGSCACARSPGCDFTQQTCGGTQSCSLACSNQISCSGTCGKSCGINCSDGSNCTVTVGPSGNVACTGGSTCDVTCTGSCAVSCTASTCNLTCQGDTASHAIPDGGQCP